MHDMEGYTHTEIAAILGVPEGTCKSRLSAARARLELIARISDRATRIGGKPA